MRHRGHATPLMAQLAVDGKIPGLTRDTLVGAAVLQEQSGVPSLVRMPVVFCEMNRWEARCGNQLVTHWYAVNPVTDLKLACLWCARVAHENGETVSALLGEDFE